MIMDHGCTFVFQPYSTPFSFLVLLGFHSLYTVMAGRQFSEHGRGAFTDLQLFEWRDPKSDFCPLTRRDVGEVERLDFVNDT